MPGGTQLCKGLEVDGWDEGFECAKVAGGGLERTLKRQTMWTPILKPKSAK